MPTIGKRGLYTKSKSKERKSNVMAKGLKALGGSVIGAGPKIGLGSKRGSKIGASKTLGNRIKRKFSL